MKPCALEKVKWGRKKAAETATTTEEGEGRNAKKYFLAAMKVKNSPLLSFPRWRVDFMVTVPMFFGTMLFVKNILLGVYTFNQTCRVRGGCRNLFATIEKRFYETENCPCWLRKNAENFSLSLPPSYPRFSPRDKIEASLPFPYPTGNRRQVYSRPG